MFPLLSRSRCGKIWRMAASRVVLWAVCRRSLPWEGLRGSAAFLIPRFGCSRLSGRGLMYEASHRVAAAPRKKTLSGLCVAGLGRCRHLSGLCVAPDHRDPEYTAAKTAVWQRQYPEWRKYGATHKPDIPLQSLKPAAYKARYGQNQRTLYDSLFWILDGVALARHPASSSHLNETDRMHIGSISRLLFTRHHQESTRATTIGSKP